MDKRVVMNSIPSHPLVIRRYFGDALVDGLIVDHVKCQRR